MSNDKATLKQEAETINNIAMQNNYGIYAKGILPYRNSPYLVRIKKLYDQGIEFFTESEILQTNKIIHFITEGAEPFALITGNPASGKSVLAYNIARKIENSGENYKVYYYTCREDLSPNDLMNDIRFYNQVNQDNKKLFIIDDIHLSPAKAFYFFSMVKGENINCAILFVSRIMQDDFKEGKFIDKDIYDELEEVTFELEFSSYKVNSVFVQNINEKVKTNLRSMNKIQGIVKNFSQKHNLSTPSNETIENLFNTTGFDLLNLSYYLSAWEEKASNDPEIELQLIEESDVLKHIYSENLLKRDPHERDSIIKYASMYQFEVWFEVQYDDYYIVQQLMQDGLIVRENNIYSFYHSKFAELLIKSYLTCDEFSDLMYKNAEDLVVFNLSHYILSYLNNRARKYPKNIFELFDGMLGGRNRYLHNDRNNNVTIFNKLLDDVDIKNIVIDFFRYSGIEPLNIWKFMEFVSKFADQFYSEFENILILHKKYAWLKEKLMHDLGVDSFLAFILFINKYKEMFDIFTDAEIEELIAHSDYHSLKNLYSINDEEIRQKIKSLHTDHEWYLLLKESSIDKIKDTLIFIEKIEPEFSAYLLSQLSDDDICKKINNNFIAEFTSVAPIIKKIDNRRIKQILSKYDDNFIVEKVLNYLNINNDGSSMLVVSDFIQMINDADAEKTILLLSYIDFEKIESVLSNYELQQIISFFSKIKEIDAKKACILFDSFSFEFICDKVKGISANKLLNLISEIKYLNETTACSLMHFVKEILIKSIPEIKLETFLSYEKKGIIVIEKEITSEIMGRLPDEYIRKFYNLKDMRDITRLLSLYRYVDLNKWKKSYILNEILDYVDINFGERFLHKKWLPSTMQLLSMCSFFNKRIKSIGDESNKKRFTEILLAKGNLTHFARNISVINMHDKEFAKSLQIELNAQLEGINSQLKGMGIFMNTILVAALKFLCDSVKSGVTWDLIKYGSSNVIQRFKEKFVCEEYFDSDEKGEEFLRALCTKESLNEDEPFDDVRTLYKKYAAGKQYDLFEPIFKDWLTENAADILTSGKRDEAISVFSHSKVEQNATTINNIAVQNNNR